jgi:SAM-dependent methyltransferase
LKNTGKDLNKKRGILLDLGCGRQKVPTFVGMDKVALDNVDIVHDIEEIPWPLDDESCLTIVARHIIEHIKPWLTIPVMDEIWRVMKPHGQLAIATPYAGSMFYWSDPTHCNGCTDRTFWYFDPEHPSRMYDVYRPKPWEILQGFPLFDKNGMMEVLLRKREEKS